MADKLVTLSEVKDLLDAAKDERELNMEQKYALAHATAFARFSKKDAEKLLKKLMAEEFVTERVAFKIVDTAPTTADEVKAVFAKEKTVLGKAEIEKVIAIVKEFK